MGGTSYNKLFGAINQVAASLLCFHIAGHGTRSTRKRSEE